MNQRTRKIWLWVVATLFLQGSIYFYLDQMLLAPTAAYEVTAPSETLSGGQVYYSRDRRYSAIVKNDSLEIHMAAKKESIRTIPLGGKKVSFFKWLEDRDLALMAVQADTGKGTDSGEVVLTQIHPAGAVHELSETISNLPKGSKITDVAYSTATNVIYMQIQTAVSPDQFRVYRTDANHDLQRVYMNTSRMGKMAVLFDQDWLIYEDLSAETIVARHGDGSWDVISPTLGKYRLVGVDARDTIYIARLNAQGLATAVWAGKSKGKFIEERVLQTPLDPRQLTIKELGKTAR